jgi:phosphoribosylformylglycinamidine (FGAM) synthase-like enzyme
MSRSLYIRRETPFPLFEVALVSASDQQLLDVSRELGLGLSLEEMRAVQKYFMGKGRNPTDVELQTVGQTWSEHCFHKTFKGIVKFDGKEVDSLLKLILQELQGSLIPAGVFLFLRIMLA